MAKRFTDTDKWKKPFIRSLPVEYKLLWFYILDDCDITGVWEVDFEVASIRTGMELDEKKAEKLFNGHIEIFDGGKKWFIIDFISFQYGELKETNSMHRGVSTQLNKYSSKGLYSPFKGAKEKDTEKEEVKEKEEGGTGETIFNPVGLVPQMVDDFVFLNCEYPVDQKIDFPAVLEIAKRVNKWVNNGKTIIQNSEAIRRRWGEIIRHVSSDNHLCKYSISQISKHYQSIIQSINNRSNGKNGSKHPKPGSTAAAADWLNRG